MIILLWRCSFVYKRVKDHHRLLWLNCIIKIAYPFLLILLSDIYQCIIFFPSCLYLYCTVLWMNKLMLHLFLLKLGWLFALFFLNFFKTNFTYSSMTGFWKLLFINVCFILLNTLWNNVFKEELFLLG